MTQEISTGAGPQIREVDDRIVVVDPKSRRGCGHDPRYKLLP